MSKLQQAERIAWQKAHLAMVRHDMVEWCRWVRAAGQLKEERVKRVTQLSNNR